MARRRITRKELLRQPDQFITRSARVIEWAETNASSILYGVGAVLIVGALVGGWFVWQAKWHHQAEALLYEAINAGDGGDVVLQADRLRPTCRSRSVVVPKQRGVRVCPT